MVDFAFEFRWLDTMLNVLIILQQVFQGNWYYCHPLLLLPNLKKCSIEKLGYKLCIILISIFILQKGVNYSFATKYVGNLYAK